MQRVRRRGWTGLVALVLFGMGLSTAATGWAADETHVSGPFSGVKVNGGTVTHQHQGGHSILTLSADFEPPGTPDPHWQVVDSQGRTHLLQRVDVKGDRLNRSIPLPDYVPDVAKVQMWCAFAETLLGEASFASPVK